MKLRVQRKRRMHSLLAKVRDHRKRLLFNEGNGLGVFDSSQGGDDADTIDDIIATLEAASANPYVGAAVSVLKVYGFITDSAFKQRVESDLDWIREKLEEVKIKVDQILSLVTRLPGIIKREMEENTKTELLTEVWADRKVAEGILANYVKGGAEHGHDIKRDHIEKLSMLAADAIKTTYQLSKWGQDAHVGVAFGYTIYLFIVRASGQSITDPKHTRDDVRDLIVESGSILKKARDELSGIRREADAKVLIINAIPRRILLVEKSYTFYYAELYGDVERGFSFGPVELAAYAPPEGYVWARDVAPWLATLDNYDDYQVVEQKVLDMISIEMQRRKAEIPKQETFDELDALIKSADALAKAIQISKH
ncbi:hypothetical protein AWB76_05251 [Caballeronia temeraria]|uniref:Uncharacterized protein n=1 Tax=Caballeronia temeraria TaxID=1777137 RepID=A0A158C907_9BURK|nr:hypothetical protein [Caballeronia temeraria]SAK78770.1 hypothetical protein AWB76_05251 [Caballeronia temeraria]